MSTTKTSIIEGKLPHALRALYDLEVYGQSDYRRGLDYLFGTDVVTAQINPASIITSDAGRRLFQFGELPTVAPMQRTDRAYRRGKK